MLKPLSLATLLLFTAAPFVQPAAALTPCQPDLAQQQTCSKRVVEVMFVLDTTGSMKRLIAGAKEKIWSIATEIVENDANAIVRMGLVGFRDVGDDYVTRFFNLTDDVDSLYGHLVAFTANGGGDTPESVNQALHEAISQTSWNSAGSNNIRLVFLVGDAPPHMDYGHDVKYHQSLEAARERGIVVHTLQAGRQSMTRHVWKEIARLGHGIYAQIPLSGNVSVIETPYDDQIHGLQRQLEETVIPYGNRVLRQSYRKKIATRRIAASPSASADRAAYRAKKLDKREVVTGGGDLLAEIASGSVKAEALEEAKLPKRLRALSPADRKKFIDDQKRKRAEIDEKLKKLLAKRNAFLKEHASKAKRDDSFDKVIRKAIRKAF